MTRTKAAHHFLDVLYGRLKKRPLMFFEGWGDEDILHKALNPPPLDTQSTLNLKWTPQTPLNGISLAEAEFDSPGVPSKPPITRAVVQRWGTASNGPALVALAASGEAGFSRRQALHAPLVERGITAFFLENPFYGRRQPDGQPGTALRTFADQLTMNMLTIQETCALFRTLAETGYDPIILTGYSMGGHMAAYAASHLDTRLGVAAFATGLSPIPIYTQNVLSWSIDWDRLGPKARLRIADLFQPTLDRLPSLHPEAEAILVAPKQDGFVSSEEVLRLHRRWPKSELRWCRGGHVSSYVFRRTIFRKALFDIFDRLKTNSSRPG